MANLRTIRQRIRSVQSTQKITRAMQMVAGAKLRRSLEELVAFRPYAERLEGMAERFLRSNAGVEHPLLGSVHPELVEGRTEPPAGLLVLTSDTGLCGTYNERVLELAENFLREFPSAKVVAIGRKGSRSLAHREIPRWKEILDWGGKFDPAAAGPLLDWLKERFLQGEVSAWHLVYTHFRSALSFKPMVERLLPLERAVPAGGARINPGAEPADLGLPPIQIVEPDPRRLAGALLGEVVRARFARFLLEAFTSEHSARMVAMKNATENAEEMVSGLTLVRNKVRQASITKELIEVVSGAEALR